MKFVTTIMFDSEVHTKLSKLSAIRKNFFGEKNMSMSGIVNTAMKEYFENHSDEIDALMDRYHSEGGCANL